jgi:hypothetical protein
MCLLLSPFILAAQGQLWQRRKYQPINIFKPNNVFVISRTVPAQPTTHDFGGCPNEAVLRVWQRQKFFERTENRRLGG